MKLTKVLKAFYLVATALWVIWVFASIWDVTFHNLDPNPVYQEWNLINVGDAS